jgi:T-complex protein 1 subunit eta
MHTTTNNSDNAGLDATDVLNKLRQAHAQSGTAGRWMGVNVDADDICDTMSAGVWEPTINKRNSIRSAIEAACMILSIDETVKNPQVSCSCCSDAC